MRADREPMTWMDADAPALGGEERSDETPRAETGQARRVQASASVFAFPMMLAFLIDQMQLHCCEVFQQARVESKRAQYFWNRMRQLFVFCRVHDWATLYWAVATRPCFELPAPDTS